MAPSNTPRVLSQLLAVILAAVVIGTLYLAKTVIFPLALALLITFMFAPLVGWLERIRVPRIQMCIRDRRYLNRAHCAFRLMAHAL